MAPNPAAAGERRLARLGARAALAAAILLALASPAPADLASARRALESGDFRKALADASFEAPNQPFQAHSIRGDAFTGMARAREAEAPGGGSVLFRQAVGEYQRALAHKPGDRDLVITIGQRLGEAGLPKQAVQYYERAHAMRPDDYETLKAYMELLHALGRYGTFFEAGHAALERESEPARQRELNKRLSDVYAERTKWPEAGNTLQASFQGTEPSAEEWAALGALRQKSKQWRQAVLAYEKARAIDQKSFEIAYQLGESYWESGDSDRACEMYAVLINGKAPQAQIISSQPNKWRQVQVKINPLAWLIHPSYGLYPFLMGVGGFFVLLLIFALVKLRGMRTAA